MVLVLLIGDLHIPYRTHDLPLKFKKLLVPGKIQQILCTGNVCDRETYEYLRTIANEAHIVRGEYDDNPAFPMSLVAQHGPLRIGVVHGHQAVPLGDVDALAGIARQMDVDVLVSGGTHRFEAKEHEGRFFVNPGSATGAWSAGSTEDATPSFALMDIQGSVIVTFVYQLVDGEVRVDKIEYRKADTSTRPPGAAAPGASAALTSPKPTPPRAVGEAQSVW